MSHKLRYDHDRLESLQGIARTNVCDHIIRTTPPLPRDELSAAKGILTGLALSAIFIIPFIVAWVFGG
jgi:hypothetical protein